ncbi:MAG: hypothetical protein IT259_14410 [Saprospiraceae bacterium]|nr:hypothetical protein [Saprospiraceae bacterium]
MRLLAFLIVLSFAACSSPEQRFNRLQRDFLHTVARQGTFVIVEQNDSLVLPLPPLEADAEQIRQSVRALQERSRGVDAGRLPPEQQARFAAFSAMLDSLAQPGRQPWPHPEKYCLSEPLERFSTLDRAGLICASLEKLPEYYARVQERWLPCAPEQAMAASDCSQAALDALDRLESRASQWPAAQRDRLRNAVAPARGAIKDFIGRCRSAVLTVQ